MNTEWCIVCHLDIVSRGYSDMIKCIDAIETFVGPCTMDWTCQCMECSDMWGYMPLAEALAEGKKLLTGC